MGMCSFCCLCLKKSDNESTITFDSTKGRVTSVTSFNFIQKFTPGTLVTITSVPQFGISRFSVDVYGRSSETAKEDIVFHFNPRMKLKYIVRNTLKNDSWGQEEKTSHRNFPFEYNRPFTLELLATDTQWIVYVDSELYCEFKNRIQIDYCTHLQVVGLENPSISVTKVDMFPMPRDDMLLVPHYDSESINKDVKWGNNARAFLEKEIAVGSQLVVKGILRRFTHSFVVELTDGIHEWPHVTTVLHLNPRLSACSPKQLQAVILNSWCKGWGQEKKAETGKFVGGQNVELRIVREPNSWVVYHGLNIIGELSHVVDPNLAKAIRIKGDLFPSEIYTCEVNR